MYPATLYITIPIHSCNNTSQLLSADDISYDGGRVDSPAETVQEALDDLLDRKNLPVVAANGINWRNDRLLPYNGFREGLAVTFSEEMHPAGASSDTFIVTLEVPDETSAPGGRRPVIVNGKVGVAGRTWTFIPDALDDVTVGQWVETLGGSLRCRVRLTGEVILDLAGVRPLDGEAVGQIAPDGYETFIDLRLPSGNGIRGGDFQSWFYLTAPRTRVTIEAIDPDADRVFPQDDGPAAILITFSDPVRFASLDAATLTVTRKHSLDPVGTEERVPGTIQPYPFEVSPEFVTRITFAPEQPETLRPAGVNREGSFTYTVRLRGTGDQPIIGADGRPIDGGRTNAASDFESNFQVLTHEG